MEVGEGVGVSAGDGEVSKFVDDAEETVSDVDVVPVEELSL